MKKLSFEVSIKLEISHGSYEYHFTHKEIMFFHIPEEEDSNHLEIKQQLFNEVFSVCTGISYFREGLERSHEDSRD